VALVGCFDCEVAHELIALDDAANVERFYPWQDKRAAPVMPAQPAKDFFGRRHRQSVKRCAQFAWRWSLADPSQQVPGLDRQQAVKPIQKLVVKQPRHLTIIHTDQIVDSCTKTLDYFSRVSKSDLGDKGPERRRPRRKPRAGFLALLWLGVFVGSALAISLALLSTAGGGSCGPNCYTDVYIGPGAAVAIVSIAIVLATLTVLLVTRRRRRHQHPDS
jgi:hypothetical protein